MIRERRVESGLLRGAAVAMAAVALGVAAGLARAQEPPAAAPPASTPPTSEGPRQVGDLSTRFRFLERYAIEAAQAGPRDLTQYRVASRDVIRRVVEKAQGTPDRTERSVQVIYTERPTVINTQGMVTDTVRRYDAFRVTPAPELRPSAPKPLEGLSVWFRNRPNQPPLLMSLDGSRLLTESEYAITLRQVFLPDLSAALPTLPSHVGDRWRLPKSASQALLGERPMAGSEPLLGTLLDVRKPGGGADWSAVVGITGRAVLQGGDTPVNAQIVFTFAAPEGGAVPADGVFDAPGSITEVRLARSSVAAVPGSNGRLKATLTWELFLQRLTTDAGAPLAAPSPPPTPNEANSWLTYDDPKGRFHFRHPQDFMPQNLAMMGQEDVVQLADIASPANEGRIITLKLQTPTGNAEEDKAARDPDVHAKQLNEEWAKSRQDVLRGPAGWLPEAEWAPFKMQVHRIEAALKPPGDTRNAQRIFLDHYLVRFAQNESLLIDAMTQQDPPAPFREQVEAILRTFAFGPPKAPAAAPAAVR